MLIPLLLNNFKATVSSLSQTKYYIVSISEERRFGTFVYVSSLPKVPSPLIIILLNS